MLTVENGGAKPRMTVAHVAARAGVSRAAVYAVLNRDKKMNIGVSESTCRKVLDAIDELGYIPNETARTLVSNRSRIVGLILPNSETEFALRLSDCLAKRFARNGVMVIPAYSGNDAAQEREQLRAFLGRNIDCLFWARISTEINQDMFELYRDYKVPVVRLGREVAFNETRVMELIAEHAVAAGAKTIGFLGYADKMTFSDRERRERLELALGRCPELSFAGAAAVRGYHECLAFAESWKCNPARPDLIVCFNDRLAGLLIHAFSAAGVKVPEEAGVIGIDGYPDPFLPLTLTSVKLPVERMAEALWNAYEDIESLGGGIVIEPEMVVGKSTARK